VRRKVFAVVVVLTALFLFLLPINPFIVSLPRFHCLALRFFLSLTQIIVKLANRAIPDPHVGNVYIAARKSQHDDDK